MLSYSLQIILIWHQHTKKIAVHFVKGIYALEGDEALALTCFHRISTKWFVGV